ncbi:MAG: DUF4097 domain-containing protein [Bacteroidetes bacterium]|jgi:DUF4097 and DUF4098 domain-containing protein YvlB|nr:DUF4097 domain-containing protein [Bacteroidota bacterium]
MTSLTVIAAAILLMAGPDDPVVERDRTLERRIPVGPAQEVEVRGLRGSEIEFKTWDEAAVKVQLRIVVSSSDEEWEERYLKHVELSVDSSREKITITYREPDANEVVSGSWLKRLFNFRGYRQMEVSGVVMIPRKNGFMTDLRFGTISLAGVEGEVRLEGQSNTVEVRDCPRLSVIRNDYGHTKVERSGGDLRVEAKSGELTIKEFKGALEAEADYAGVTMAQVVGNVKVNDKSGTVRLSDVKGDVEVDADYSRVTIERVAGVVRVTDKSGSVQVRTVDGIDVNAPYSEVEIANVSGTRGMPIVIRGQSGRLLLEQAVGDVRIDNSYSRMDLADIKGDVDLRAQSATVEADRVEGDWNSETAYTQIRVRALRAANVLVSNSSNTVSLELEKSPAKLNVRNSYGNVDIAVPKGYAGKVRLKSEYGSIRTDLPLEVDNFGSGSLATGTVAGGTSSFTVEVKSGDVRVRQR